jgi:hypothetical protein
VREHDHRAIDAAQGLADDRLHPFLVAAEEVRVHVLERPLHQRAERGDAGGAGQRERLERALVTGERLGRVGHAAQPRFKRLVVVADALDLLQRR